MNKSSVRYASSISLASDALMHASQLIVPTVSAKPAPKVANSFIGNLPSDALMLGSRLRQRLALARA